MIRVEALQLQCIDWELEPQVSRGVFAVTLVGGGEPRKRRREPSLHHSRVQRRGKWEPVDVSFVHSELRRSDHNHALVGAQECSAEVWNAVAKELGACALGSSP